MSASLLMLMQIGLANTTGADKGKGASEAQKESQEQQTGKQTGQQEKLDEEPSLKGENEMEEVNQDTVEDDSVSKYNFIFYFLYKFKYDHEEAL